MQTQQRAGVLARGMGLAAIAVLAAVVALSTAAVFADQLRSLGSSPTSAQGPGAAVAYEPR